MLKPKQLQYTVAVGDEQSSEYVRQKLLEYNSRFVQPAGPAKRLPVHLVIKAKDGSIMGGLSANIFYLRACCYINWLWVKEELRGQGYGTQLMAASESKAKSEGCRTIFVDTCSYQAPGFYIKLGYQQYGKLDDYPASGITAYYYQKKL